MRLNSKGILSKPIAIAITICILLVISIHQSAYMLPGKISGLSGIVSNTDLKVQNPVAEEPKFSKTTYNSHFTWSSPQTMHGIYSSTELYFKLPSYWDTKYAYIEVEYRVSQLIMDVPCSLTFSVNKQPFYSCSVAYNANKETQTLYVLIPKNLLKNDPDNSSNYLKVSGYADLYNEKGCIDNSSDANWITITENSGVQVGYEAKEHKNRIDYYPYPFAASYNPTGSDTAIAVSDAARNEEISTAMFIMSGLSNNTKDENGIAVGTWKDIKAGSFKNRIFVGLTKNVPAELQKYIITYRDQLKGQVMILFTNDDIGNPLMLIVSDDPDCLMEAGHFLADSDRVSQEKGSVTFIKKGTSDTKVKEMQLSDMTAYRYTLKDMTGGGFEFIGPFHQVKTLFLPVSQDYTLSPDVKVSLSFRYSKNLDFRRSMLTVYCGDIPIGSKKLSLEKADGDELTLFMPADLIGTKASNLMFAFDLEIPYLFCTPRQGEMPWAYITPDSTISLPADNSIRINFDNRPAPFQKNGSLNNVLLVVSDSPSLSELTILGRITALYGKGAGAYGQLKVCKAGEFSSNKYEDYNIITIGTPKENQLIRKVNGKLFIRYNGDGTEFLTNDKLILSPGYAKSIGTLQLLQSPYSINRAMLVLTGPDQGTLKMINKLVSNEKLSWSLKNDCVVIDSEGKIKSYQFKKTVIGEKKPTLVQSLTKNKDSLLFTLAATSVMLVIFLAMVLIILRWRISRKRKD